MVTFPLARNKIMIRLENIADIYDNATETTVALKNLTLALYKYANSKNHQWYPEVWITEMSLTGNMPLEELRKRKIQWLTRDDALLNREQVPLSDVNNVVLVPQQIKVFEVEYVTENKSDLAGTKSDDT